MKAEEIAQWVIDNRYPKSENNKISDLEMYHFIVDKLKPEVVDCGNDGIFTLCPICSQPKRK